MITDNNNFLLTNYNLLFMNCIGYLTEDCLNYIIH